MTTWVLRQLPFSGLLLLMSIFSMEAPAEYSRPSHDFNKWSLTALEERRDRIDTELQQLSQYRLRTGVGSIGYRSHSFPEDRDTEWIQIQWDRSYPIDQITLVPAIWHGAYQAAQADGFPQAFRILAGSELDTTGRVIAEYDTSDHVLPRIAPLVIPTPNLTASWIRIEVTQLSTIHAYNSRYMLQLTEIMVFSDQKNIALHQHVETSTNTALADGSWDQKYLVDGLTPYLMSSGRGEPSFAYISYFGYNPVITLDLERNYSLDSIQLHTVEQADTVPQVHPDSIGLPPYLEVWGSSTPEFSEPQLLLQHNHRSYLETGPIVSYLIPETNVRYVKFVGHESANFQKPLTKFYRIGFAEIELFSGSENVALSKVAYSTLAEVASGRTLSALTDGSNINGTILPQRQWMEELAARHELERERPLIEVELNSRYAQQKRRLVIMTVVAACCAVGIAFIILIERNLRQKQASEIRQRIAANLHDELGADLYAISLLGDHAINVVDQRDELISTAQRIRSLTEETCNAARYCTNMLESGIIGDNLVAEMKRVASRILADIDYTLTIQGETELKHIQGRRRIDLLLFYKECLINIIKHSLATHVTIQLTVSPKDLHLRVQDNGVGISDGHPPISLQRRARLMRAEVTATREESGGTIVILHAKLNRLRDLI